MRQRRKAEPSTRAASRSSRSTGEELIAKAKKKRSAKKRSTLDDLSYRTKLPFSREDSPTWTFKLTQ